jgi:hypothetical protein
VTLKQLLKDYQCTPTERKQLRMYLAFLRFVRMAKSL